MKADEPVGNVSHTVRSNGRQKVLPTSDPVASIGHAQERLCHADSVCQPSTDSLGRGRPPECDQLQRCNANTAERKHRTDPPIEGGRKGLIPNRDRCID